MSACVAESDGTVAACAVVAYGTLSTVAELLATEGADVHLSDAERAYCAAVLPKLDRYAGRIAAHRALRALGLTGEVHTCKAEGPVLRKASAARDVTLSITHDDGVAVAVVMIGEP